MPPKWGTNLKRRYRFWETEDSTQKGISRMMVKADLRWIAVSYLSLKQLRGFHQSFVKIGPKEHMCLKVSRGELHKRGTFRFQKIK